MARQPKKGLDYFPVDVSIMKERKLRKIKLEYGYLGFMVYFSILCLIYEDKGYYLEYSENKKDDVVWEILEMLQGKFQPTAQTIVEIIEGLVSCELFSQHHFNSKIITSKRIQSTYYSATVEREAIAIDFDIWLLSIEEMTGLSKRSSILKFFINRTINEENRTINKENRTTSTQSKVKESKLNKSKVKESKETVAFAPPSILEIEQFCKEEYLSVNPKVFFNYYNTKDWFVGKNKMRDWKSSVRLWEEREKEKNSGKERKGSFTISELETLIEQERLT